MATVMQKLAAPQTIDEYILQFSPGIQEILHKIRKLIQQLAPEATETIGYGIPTFKLNGNLVHFAAFKKHIGFFPGPEAIEFFHTELTQYKTSKGAIQFQLDEPIPYDLVKKIVKYRVKSMLTKKK